MLYEMIAGRSPFGGVNALEVIGEILKSEPQPLSQYATETPAELQRIVGKALRKNREERYQTARDLLNDLKDLKEELSFTAKRARAGQTGKNEAVTVPVDAVPTAAGAAVQTTSSAKIILGEIKRHKLGVALMLALLLVVVGVLLWRGKEKAKVPPPLRVATFTQLTRQPGQELFPSLSPDGKLLVYASNESTRIAEAGNWNLYLQRVGGATPINLTSDSAADNTQPAFSPDGEQIVFRSGRDGGGLFVMGATGENVRRLTDHGYNPAWSADGQEVVYSTSSFAGPSQRGPLGLLYAVNVVTRETRQITKADAVQPNCSPHGHRIAYWGVQRGGQRDIWTIPAGGGQPVPVTNDAAVDWNPVWSPEGNYLYFASDRGGSMNLWRVPIDEQSGKLLGAPEPFTTPAAYSGYLSFSRDGHRLAYAQVSNQVNLQQFGFDPAQERIEGNPRWITRGSRVATNPDLSADGQWIVFDNIGDKQEDLFVIRRDGTGLRQITNDQLKDRAPRWSPDGKRILFFSDRSGRYELWTIKADGSGLEQLTRTAGPGLQISIWSPDGARIVCGRQGVPPMLLAADKPWAQQSPQSLPTEGYPPEFLPWSWSADGQKLAGYDDASIFSYSFASQRYERLADFGDRPVWLNDNRRVLFFSQEKLLLLDSQTRKVREILSVAPNRFQSLGLSRDGRVIYFSLQTIEADIWLASLE
jgi:Tol biopolymer transport system component